MLKDNQTERVELYTDGACPENPGGPGGWGVVLIRPAYYVHPQDIFDQSGKYSKTISGSLGSTTSNRMEMTAAIKALELLDKLGIDEPVILYSDSKYLINGITSWIKKWKSYGWNFSANSQRKIKNLWLWKRLDELNQRHQITWKWIKGHAGHQFNELADRLAGIEVKAQRRKTGNTIIYDHEEAITEGIYFNE